MKPEINKAVGKLSYYALCRSNPTAYANLLRVIAEIHNGSQLIYLQQLDSKRAHPNM